MCCPELWNYLAPHFAIYSVHCTVQSIWFGVHTKNPAYGRHWISRTMRIIRPIQKNKCFSWNCIFLGGGWVGNFFYPPPTAIWLSWKKKKKWLSWDFLLLFLFWVELRITLPPKDCIFLEWYGSEISFGYLRVFHRLPDFNYATKGPKVGFLLSCLIDHFDHPRVMYFSKDLSQNYHFGYLEESLDTSPPP